MWFCVYINILPLCCVPHLLILLRCSLAFVILPVSILLVSMPLFSEPCLLLYYSSPKEDLLVFSLPIVWQGACSPRHSIEILPTYLLQFFIYYFILCFVLFYIGIFILTNTVPTKVAKNAKSELHFCFFVILLFLLP